MGKTFRIGIVGPCAAGKTTLISSLIERGYNARHIAQEHSYVADMWKRITDPDVLIFLDVSYESTLRRRLLTWTMEEYQEQVHRLRHARTNADLYLNTDTLSPQEVFSRVCEYLNRKGYNPARPIA